MKPSIKELGFDLLALSRFQLIITLATPFFFLALYFFFAFAEMWPMAVVCTMAVSFTSYGSTSHDLVHENLRLNKSVNALLLTSLELLCFRSGHAYKLSHLHHHNRYPNEDDVEGAAARMTLIRTLFEGVIFQVKIYRWALVQSKTNGIHRLVKIEGMLILVQLILCVFTLKIFPAFFVYMCLMIAGSWIIPLITSYLVHTPAGANELQQTRLFRGRFFSLIAFDHLYHLEHHLYPMVPHKNWPKLAARLNDYFKVNGVRAIEVKLL